MQSQLFRKHEFVPGPRETNLRQGEMTADRQRRLTTYEKISLNMMIKKEGMSAAKSSSSLPEAKGTSVRRLREIMRHSEMLTKSSS